MNLYKIEVDTIYGDQLCALVAASRLTKDQANRHALKCLKRYSPIDSLEEIETLRITKVSYVTSLNGQKLNIVLK